MGLNGLLSATTKATGNLETQLRNFGNIEWDRLIQALLKGWSIDELDHQVGNRLFFYAVNLDDVLMLNRCGRTSLAEKAFSRRRCRRDFGIEH